MSKKSDAGEKEPGGKVKVTANAKPKNDSQGFAKAFRSLRNIVSQSKKSGGGSNRSSRPARGAPTAKVGTSMQRCSVRVTYANNKGDGQWGAHGKYIARESASLENQIESAPAQMGEEKELTTQEEISNEQPGREPESFGAGRVTGIEPSSRDRILRNGRDSALYKPYIGEHYERGLAPKSLNSLRSLSGISVARIGAKGAEMLLPGDARNKLEPGGAERHSILRRGSDGKSGKAKGRKQVNKQPARGFGSDGDNMEIAGTLDAWQKSNDDHLFKLIISPEFGEKMDLQRHTKELVKQMEKDTGTRLQWVAVEHFNTEHPHVHLAIRGVDDQGQPLRLGKEYIKTGIRANAQRLATNQLGYRTHEDMRLAAERQVTQQRFTELDRALRNKSQPVTEGHKLDYNTPIPKAQHIREARLREIRRLQQLCTMGLAHKTGPLTWVVDRSFEQALRQMQVGNDRLKSLHEQRHTLSDPRLPLVATELRNVRRLSGKVIGTGLDENRGIPYLLLEGTDAKVHYLYQDGALNEARRKGQLQPGAVVEIERQFIQGGDGRKRAQIVVTDRGPAEALLTDQKHLARDALRAAKGQPSLPRESGYGGWLGRYHKAVAKRAQELVKGGQLKPGPNGYEYAARGKSGGIQR